MTEIYTTGFQRSFFDDDDLTSIAESDVIYAFQAPPLYIRGGSTRISGNHEILSNTTFLAQPKVKSRYNGIKGTLLALICTLNYLKGILKIICTLKVQKLYPSLCHPVVQIQQGEMMPSFLMAYDVSRFIRR